MALVKCFECGNSISDRAPACPSCGAPLALANVALELQGIDRALIGRNDFVVRVKYNESDHSVIEQGESVRLTFPSGGNFVFSCDVPGITLRRKTHSLSYVFPDGFHGRMKFAIEGSLSQQLVAYEI